MVYRHILIATDGSELSRKAVTQGLDLAKAVGARVTVVMVTEPLTTLMAGEVAMPFPSEEYEQAAALGAARSLAEAANLAKERGLECATEHIRDQFPAEGIVDAAKRHGNDLIVMASHGRRGLTRFLLGSVAVEVLTHTAVPVLICR